MKIKDILDEVHIDDNYLIANVSKGISSSNATYLNVTLQDCTGTIEAKKWDASAEDIELLVAGKIIHVVGDANKYRNTMQIKIVKAETVDAKDIDYQDFVMSAPVAKEKLEEELKYYLSLIHDNDLKLLVDALIQKHYQEFLTHPAATRNHHEYCSGLLHYSIGVAKLVCALADTYPTLDKEILVAGALLHDIGKIEELSGPIIPTYTTEGRLIGHISIMQAEIREIADKLNIKSEVPLLLEHMILSHHGKREFGSPVLPMTKEALVLNFADDLDAKMNMLDKAYEVTEEGKFTNRIYALDDRSFYKPKRR